MNDKTATKTGRRFARTPADPAATDPASSAPKTVDSSSRPESKIVQVNRLLERVEGATLAELVEATGWLPHTTRAALTGLKKKGKVITKRKRDDVTCYFIAGPSA